MEPTIKKPVESTRHKLITRTILILMGIAVALEIIWAGYTLTKPAITLPQKDNMVEESQVPAVISLLGPHSALVGSQVKVDIFLDTKDPSIGADIIINYDPKVLSLQPVTIQSKQVAASAGAVYQDYPLNSFDPKKGQITLSAISGTEAKAFVGQGIVGSVTFKALKAGSTTLSVDYVKDSTTHSNVVGTKATKNILGSVNNLTLSIK